MGAFDNKESRRIAIIILVIVVVVILVLALLFGGTQGLFGIIKFFITIGLVFAFFGFAFWVVWFIFIKKHKKDIPFENWKGYLKSAIDNGSDMMNELVLTGDKYHSSKTFMTIKGYLRIKGFDGKEYDLFAGKKNPMNLFEDYKIVMLRPDHHSDLIGDVYTYGISLIKKYGFYFLNTTMMDFDGIDKAVAKDTYRTLLFDTLGDMKQITDRAIGLDPEYRKEQMQQKLLKIPVLSGQQPPQGEQQ